MRNMTSYQTCKYTRLKIKNDLIFYFIAYSNGNSGTDNRKIRAHLKF